jgi:Ca-activated chloride channel family protein
VRFASPEWLLLGLSAVVALALSAAWSARRRRRIGAQVDPALFAAMTEADRPERVRRRQWWLGLAALVLASVALARPQYGHRTEVRKGLGIELVFALDLSRSMLAEDVKPSRLERARLELEDLLRRLEGHRVGLVGFTTVGIPLTPLTVDRSAVHLQLERAEPSIMPRGGTSIAQAIESARGLLEAAQTPGAGRAIVVVTDGEDHEGRAEAAARRAQEAGIDVHVVGIGGTEGQPIPEYEDGVRRGYVKDDVGRTVLTRLEPESLRAIAEAGGGVAALPGPRAGGIDFRPLRRHLAALDEAELQARTVRVYEERYRWFLWPALVVLLLSTLLGVRRRRSSVVGMAVLVLGAAWPTGATAQSVLERPEPEVKAGVEALREGDAERAEATFDRLIETLGPTPELLYDRGLARAAQERWDEAVRDFEQAAREAANPSLRGRAQYALGNAHRRAERLDEAIDAYRQALLSDPSLEAARKNLEVTRAMKALAPPPPPSGGGESEQRDEGDGARDPSESSSGDGSDEREKDESGSESADDGDEPPQPDPADADAPPESGEAGDRGRPPRDDGTPREEGPGTQDPSDPPSAQPDADDEDGRSEGRGQPAGPPEPADRDNRPDGRNRAGPAAPGNEIPDDVDALLEALRQQERVLQKKLYQQRYGGGRRVEKDW